MTPTNAGRRLAALTLAAGLLLTACTPTDEPTEDPTTQGPLPTLPGVEPTATETPSAEPTESLTPEQQADADATVALEGFFVEMARVGQEPETYDPLVESRAVAAGSAMTELATMRERQLNGNLRSEGEFEIESTEVTMADYTGEQSGGAPTMEITTCFNSRGITFYKDGVLADDLSDTPTEATVFGVSYYDHEEPAGWRVVYMKALGYENPAC